MRFARDSIVVTILNGISQVSRFLVLLMIVTLFGANWRTDAFLLAQTIPALFINSVKDSLQTVYIPVISELRRTDPGKNGRLIGASIFYSVVFSFVISALLALFLQPVLRWTTPNLTLAARDLTYLNVLMLLPMIALQLVNGLLSAVYYSNAHFWPPASSEAIRYLLTFALMFALKSFLNIYCLPVSFVGGTLIQTVLLVALWRKNKVRLVFSPRMEPELVRSLKLTFPLLMGMVMLQVGVVVSRFLAARLAEGSVTLVDVASRISSGIMELLSSGVMMVALADWSSVALESDKQLLQDKLLKTIRVTLYIFLPIIALMISLRQTIVNVFLLRGEFPSAMAPLVAVLFAIYLLAIPIDMVGRFYVRVLLAFKDTMTIGLLGVGRVIFTILMSILLISFFQIKGIALAELIALIFTTGGFIIATYKKRGIHIGSKWQDYILNFCLAAICGGSASLVMIFLKTENIWLSSLFAATVGGTVYFALSCVFYRDLLFSAIKLALIRFKQI